MEKKTPRLALGSGLNTAMRRNGPKERQGVDNGTIMQCIMSLRVRCGPLQSIARVRNSYSRSVTSTSPFQRLYGITDTEMC